MNSEHAELAARTLQVASHVWQAVLEDYHARVPPRAPGESHDDEISRCLGALALAYARYSPHSLPLVSPAETEPCPACGARAVRPYISRRPSITYGRCSACGHGVLLCDAAGQPSVEHLRAVYGQPSYFAVRGSDGVGYDQYEREAVYREGKGVWLAEQLRALPAPPASLLEVGSGFGYTRAGAERCGLRTAGVDLNPHACEQAWRRYAFDTFQGTLADALASPRSNIVAGEWDAVLYQFVLEHVVEPVSELAVARRALRPGGWLVLMVPSMDAAEIDAFGASYRSFRADHLHLFSRASLAALLDAAGFAVHRAETFCNVHLLREVLSPSTLAYLYQSGKGPDLFVIARSST